ncbi:MAG: protein phosphatase [Lachnospiraceae bacterium]|nr:protein phosphatase [Lachnospiraceae bacterium]MBQ4068214.1 protein phosphatase [Lachnospiraceae bacterium]
MRDTMPNASETIEKLAKQLERMKFLNDLRDCETLEDLKKLKDKYEAICKEDSKE